MANKPNDTSNMSSNKQPSSNGGAGQSGSQQQRQAGTEQRPQGPASAPGRESSPNIGQNIGSNDQRKPNTER